MSATLETAVEAALAAGAVLRRHWPRARRVRSKGWRDLVTDADLAAQAAIQAVIAARCPGDAFLGEEGAQAVDLAAGGPLWIVDPLDGTTNFAHRFPSFAVSVAQSRAGVLEAGAIYDPLRRTLFYAERGGGAFLRQGRGRPRRLRPSAVAALDDAVVGVDWARDPALRARVLQALDRVATQGRTVRAIGTAALGLAYVAAGWLDAYYHLSLMPWDVAAGALIVAEAGAALTTAAGGAWRLGIPHVAASNGAVHTQFLQALGLQWDDDGVRPSA
jgi:myo-inositol-1(or 4)-monophosphatase